MKISKVDLIKVINEVVEYKLKKLLPVVEKRIRDEVEKSLIEEISKIEIKTHVDGKNLSSLVEDGERPVARRVVEEDDEDVVIPEFKFTSNPILNKVMNQTLRSPKPTVAPDASMVSILAEASGMEEQMEDVPTLNFSTNNMPLPPTRLTNVAIPTVSMESAVEQPVDDETPVGTIGGVNKSLAKTIYRDYRQILKKADEKAKIRRPL